MTQAEESRRRADRLLAVERAMPHCSAGALRAGAVPSHRIGEPCPVCDKTCDTAPKDDLDLSV